jgi:hypothetical protein
MSLDSPVFHGPAHYTAGGTQIGGVVHATSRPPDHSGPKELGKGGSISRPIGVFPCSQKKDLDGRVFFCSCSNSGDPIPGEVLDSLNSLVRGIHDNVSSVLGDTSSLLQIYGSPVNYTPPLISISGNGVCWGYYPNSTSGSLIARYVQFNTINLYQYAFLAAALLPVDVAPIVLQSLILHEMTHMVDYEFFDYDCPSDYDFRIGGHFGDNEYFGTSVSNTEYNCVFNQVKWLGGSDSLSREIAGIDCLHDIGLISNAEWVEGLIRAVGNVYMPIYTQQQLLNIILGPTFGVPPMLGAGYLLSCLIRVLYFFS